MSGGLYRLLHPHVDGRQRYLTFHEISVDSSPASAASELTESPFSTPVVQVGDVGEHVVKPVICQFRTWHMA